MCLSTYNIAKNRFGDYLCIGKNFSLLKNDRSLFSFII